MNKKTFLVLALIFLAFFLAILVCVQLNLLTYVDSSTAFSVLKIQNPIFVKIAEILGYIFDIKIMIAITIIVSVSLFLKGLKKDSLLLAIVMLVNGTFIYILKELVMRVRPLNPFETGFSFPSGHSTTSVLFFGVFIYFVFKYSKSKTARTLFTAIFSIIILIINFSRLYLNVHWLSDIIGGFFLGLFLLFSSLAIRNNKP